MSRKRNAISAEVYDFYLRGHNICETAMYFGIRKEEARYFIKREKADDEAAAAEGRVRSHELPEVSLQSEERWMTDDEIRREYRLASDKLKQIAILAQLNCLNPRAIEKIVGVTS